MLIQAAAARWEVDPATCSAAHAVVTHGASGRTLSYAALADDAAKLPVPDSVLLKDPAEFTLIGTSPRRLDTPSKVDGTAQYGIDVRLPGMGVATVSACPVKGGKLRSCNEAAAKAIPGVRDVVALDDLIAVVGDHMWAAMQGLQAAAPVWDEGANASASTDDMVARLETVSKDAGIVARADGDADTLIAKSQRRFDAVYQLPLLAHAAMEPINATVHVRPDGADLWVGTQVPGRAQAAVAKQTGLPANKVTVHNLFIGGAFGRRLEVDGIIQAARIAKRVSYPVKLIWTREEDMQHDLYRPYYFDRISAGLDAQGKVTAWSHRTTGSSVTARWAPPAMKQGGKLDADTVEGAEETPYVFPAQRNEWVRDEPKALATAYWRGVGSTHNVFVVESFMDELAAAAGKDPVEFRRSLIAPGNKRARAVLDLAVEKAGWTTKTPQGTGPGAVAAFTRPEMLRVAEVDQRVEVGDCLEDDVPALAASAAIRAAELDEPLPPERDNAVPAIAGADIDLCLVEELHASGSRNETRAGLHRPSRAITAAPAGYSAASAMGAGISTDTWTRPSAR